MEAYTSFAQVYDLFMDNVPYDAWCAEVVKILGEYGITGGIVGDLGCGTGSLTERMAAKGYDMIGIDSSADMLEIAMEKKLESGQDILYLCQDMRSFELYGTCRAFVSRCDAINYILTREDLVTVFRLVNNYLDPDGIFVFDCNTIRKYEHILAENTIAETRDIGSFIWENSYDPVTQINEYDLTLFVRSGDGRYERFSETHYQKGYEISRIKELLGRAGLECMGMWDGYSTDKAGPRSERVLFAARETLKEKTGRM